MTAAQVDAVRAMIATVEAGRRTAVDRVIDHYRPEIERAMQRFDGYAQSMLWREMQGEIESATRPFARELARLYELLPISGTIQSGSAGGFRRVSRQGCDDHECSTSN